MSNDEPLEISPDLVSLAREYGFLLPHTEEWAALSEQLKLSTTRYHMLTVSWILGQVFGKAFENFAVEIVNCIPGTHVLEYILRDKLNKVAHAKQLSLIESWFKRMRIFYFYNEVTPERVKIMSPFTSRTYTAHPFIEAIWERSRITEISMFGFAGLTQDRRAEYAEILSKGMELLRDDLKKHGLRQMVAKTFHGISKQRGRRKGTGCFKDTESFNTALNDVLKDASTNLSVAQGLYQLSQHSLWQGKRLTLKQCQDRKKTLRNWLTKAGLTWDEAKKKYCRPQ